MFQIWITKGGHLARDRTDDLLWLQASKIARRSSLKTICLPWPVKRSNFRRRLTRISKQPLTKHVAENCWRMHELGLWVGAMALRAELCGRNRVGSRAGAVAGGLPSRASASHPRSPALHEQRRGAILLGRDAVYASSSSTMILRFWRWPAELLASDGHRPLTASSGSDGLAAGAGGASRLVLLTTICRAWTAWPVTRS